MTSDSRHGQFHSNDFRVNPALQGRSSKDALDLARNPQSKEQISRTQRDQQTQKVLAEKLHLMHEAKEHGTFDPKTHIAQYRHEGKVLAEVIFEEHQSQLKIKLAQCPGATASALSGFKEPPFGPAEALSGLLAKVHQSHEFIIIPREAKIGAINNTKVKERYEECDWWFNLLSKSVATKSIKKEQDAAPNGVVVSAVVLYDAEIGSLYFRWRES